MLRDLKNQEKILYQKPKLRLISFSTSKLSQIPKIMPKVYLSSKLELDSNILLTSMLKSSSNLKFFLEWYIEIRQNQVKQLFFYHMKYKTTINSYYLSIEYLDSIMISLYQNITQKSADVITLIAFVLAKKFVEMDEEQFDLNIYNQFKGKSAVSLEYIKDYEIGCLKNLNYNLNRVTCYDLMSFLLNCKDPAVGVKMKDKKSKKITRAFDLLKDLSITHTWVKYPKIHIALAIIFIVFQKKEKESKTIANIRQLYKFDDVKVLECIKEINKMNTIFEEQSCFLENKDMIFIKKKSTYTQRKNITKLKINFNTPDAQYDKTIPSDNKRKYISPANLKNEKVYLSSSYKKNKAKKNIRVGRNCKNIHQFNTESIQVKEYSTNEGFIILPKIIKLI